MLLLLIRLIEFLQSKNELQFYSRDNQIFENNELDYSNFLSFLGEGHEKYGWIVFIFITIFIIAAFSNGANLTDGIDGLATGSSAIIVVVLALFAWVSGNIIFSDYLDVMYIPNSGEMTVYILAFAGALIGFLWYNTYPAQVFMGDTGSLTCLLYTSPSPRDS